MRDYVAFASTDLLNWEDLGVVFTTAGSSWATEAWAQQVRGVCVFSAWVGRRAAGAGAWSNANACTHQRARLFHGATLPAGVPTRALYP